LGSVASIGRSKDLTTDLDSLTVLALTVTVVDGFSR